MNNYTQQYDKKIRDKISEQFFDPVQKQLTEEVGVRIISNTIEFVERKTFRRTEIEVADLISLSLGDSELK